MYKPDRTHHCRRCNRCSSSRASSLTLALADVSCEWTTIVRGATWFFPHSYRFAGPWIANCVGYGNYNVPLVNFVVPERTLIPEADLYF